MYVGPLNDFFYKPKNWIFQQPKFNQKEENTFINMNGKLFKINDLTGEMTLCNSIKKQINFPKEEKSKKLKLANSININNNLKKYKSNKENYKNSSLNEVFPNSISDRKTKVNEYISKSPNNLIIKKDQNYNTITSENDSSINKKYLRTNYNNKYINITPQLHNKNSSSNFRSIDQTIFSNINSLPKNSNIIKFSNQYNLYNNEKSRTTKTFPYFSKTNKKYFKPPIAFGHYNFKSLSFENKKKNKYKPKYKNYLYLMYRQHKNNITGEGKANEKIYDKKKSDNIIFKTFRDQIFKEKIINGLKRKYQFYEDKNDGKLKIPLITHQNYDFYRGYSFSDNKRMPIHHKLFFKYIKKDKLKEKEELEKDMQMRNNEE